MGIMISANAKPASVWIAVAKNVVITKEPKASEGSVIVPARRLRYASRDDMPAGPCLAEACLELRALADSPSARHMNETRSVAAVTTKTRSLFASVSAGTTKNPERLGS